jgi:hypothetical protein
MPIVRNDFVNFRENGRMSHSGTGNLDPLFATFKRFRSHIYFETCSVNGK